MRPRPSSEACPTPGCSLGKDHAGNCNNWVACPTPGCSQQKGHSGACDSNE